MDKPEDTIIVNTNDIAGARGKTGKEVKINVLSENVNLFVSQIGVILEKTPDRVNKFKLTQISVTAEVSAKGSLALMGTGVETEGKGGITFVFTKI